MGGPGYCSRCHQRLPARPTICLGCSRPFEPNSHGQPKIFCSRACQRGFTLASQRFVAAAVASGRMKLAELHSFKKPPRHRSPNKPKSTLGD
jgi:predicted amidophosphoribosyltransferase